MLAKELHAIFGYRENGGVAIYLMIRLHERYHAVPSVHQLAGVIRVANQAVEQTA